MGSSFGKGIIGGLVLLLLCGAAIIGLTLVGTTVTSTDCGGSGGPATATPANVGPLGGLGGTGVTQAEVDVVRASGGATGRLRGGTFESTSYGPPWGGIQGAGQATAGGLRINGGAPRKYFVAADPQTLGLGQWVYVWPNPFGWRGAFLVADTGGAINGARLDFYDWRGRSEQNGWGRREVQVSATAIQAGEATPTTDTGVVVDSSTCQISASGPTGTQVATIAEKYLNRNMREGGFAEFSPTTIGSLPWCAWFSTNVWKAAGVVGDDGEPIPINYYSGFHYTWAQANAPGLIFKKVGELAQSSTPPLGSVLMYGSGPTSSDHVNLVEKVNADGSFMVIGGNQDSSRVTNYGPCRFENGSSGRLSGPGCDGRPIWGIVAPAGA